MRHSRQSELEGKQESWDEAEQTWGRRGVGATGKLHLGAEEPGKQGNLSRKIAIPCTVANFRVDAPESLQSERRQQVAFGIVAG